MIAPRRESIRKTVARWLPQAFGTLAVVAVPLSGALAQPVPSDTLRQRIDERFDVLVTQDVTSLRAKTPGRDFRWVELTDETITIDGVVVTGAELRGRLGDDADLVVQLSYLDQPARRQLFAGPTPGGVTTPAQAVPDAVERPDRPNPPRRRTGDRVRIGGSVTVDEDQVIAGDVVAIGGSARVFGEVQGDVVAVGGSIELGPRAVVTGNAVVVGGTLRRDPSAEIRGEVQEVGLGFIDFGDWRPGDWRIAAPWWNNRMNAALRLTSSLVRVSVLALLVGLVVLVARDYVERVGRRAAAEPVKSGVVGVLSQLLFAPLLIITIIVLVITIIGIPLLLLIPFAVLGLMVVGLVGFTSVAHFLGDLVNSRFGWMDRGPLATALVGVLIIVSPLLLARFIALAGGFLFPMTFTLSLFGTIVEYLAWTVGFGAVALSRFSPMYYPPGGTAPA